MLLPMINQKFLNLQEDIENRKNPDKSDQNTNFQNFSQDLMQNEVDDDGGPMSMFAVKKLEDLFTVEKIMCLRFRGDLYRYQSDIMTGFYQKQSIENALKSYQQASGECCKISSCHVICLKLALSHAVYYYEVLNSIEFAMKIVAEAISDSRDEYFNFKRNASESDLKQYNDCMRTLDNNLQRWKEELIDNAQENEKKQIKH
eukprot:403346508